MKKLVFIVFLFFICIILVDAKEIEVTFSKCVDGDTAKFIYQSEEIKARFLAIDTPETVHPTKKEEAWGKNASNHTCERISNANKIILEFDENSDELDKYNRYLVWVFVDNELLQNELVKLGYAKVAYLYGEYKYTEILKDSEQIAKKDKLGIWSDYIEDNNKTNIIIIIGIVIILLLIITFSKNGRKKIINKTKTKVNNKLKKEIKKIIK